MRIFHKTMISALTMFTAASLTFPVLASAASLAGATNYTVQSGDSFWKIAHEYDVSVQSLLAANSNIPIFNLQIGTNLIIPLGKTEPAVYHAAKPSTVNKQTATHVAYPTNIASSSKPVHQAALMESDSVSSIPSQNMYWMAHVINAEANAEPMEAKVAVGDVVLHRLAASTQYKTVHDVLFAVENGHYQFTCVANGYIYSSPTSSSVAAAQEVLNQHIDVVPGATVFFNPARTPSSSWVRNQPQITKIGDFIFSK
jgi:N-acetylmuramoyl-L-alanine amidase